MLIDAPGPDWARRLLTDEKNGILFERGRRTVVDGVNFPRRRGVVVASIGRIVAGARVRLTIKGQILCRARFRPHLTAIQATIEGFDDAYMELHDSADGKAFMRSRFCARINAHVHVHDDSTGHAYDESVIFVQEGWRGWVRVHPDPKKGTRPRVIPPAGWLLKWNDTMTEVRLGERVRSE